MEHYENQATSIFKMRPAMTQLSWQVSLKGWGHYRYICNYIFIVKMADETAP